MTAFGKLIRTTAFRLTLVYLFLFAVFAASLLGYFAWNTRRLINEQIATTVNGEVGEIGEIYARGGLYRLGLAINRRALRPSARPRSARSAALVVRQILPSSRKRVNEAQRLSM